MKFYTLDTTLTFGRFEGKTLREILLDGRLYYVRKYIEHLDHFYVSEEVIEEMTEIEPVLLVKPFSDDLMKCLKNKYEKWRKEQLSKLLHLEIFNLETVFTRGKFTGKPLKYLIETNQTFYIDGYALEVLDFYIDKDTIQQIKDLDPDFFISDEALKFLDQKYNAWENNKNRLHFRSYNFSNNDHENFRYYNDDLDMDQQDPRFWDFNAFLYPQSLLKGTL